MTDTTPGADREQRERVARAMWATFGRPVEWWDNEDISIDREQYRAFADVALADAALAAARPDDDTAAALELWHANHVRRCADCRQGTECEADEILAATLRQPTKIGDEVDR